MLPTEAPDPRRTSWLMAILLALAAVSIGYAIHIRDGEYSYRDGYNWILAIHWVAFGIVLTALGVFFSREREPQWGQRALLIVLGVGVALQFLQLLRSPPSGWNWWSNDLRPIDCDVRPFYAGIATAAVLSIGLFFRADLVRRICLGLLLVTHLLLGIWTIRATPAPHIDVFLFQQQAPSALLHGQNPYAMTFDDIYGSDKAGERKVYGEKLVKDGKLVIGFPYPPVSLFISTIGYGIAGDYRYMQALSMTLAGALLALARPGRAAAAAAALLLFTPRTFFVLGRGWSEPYVVVLLAATVFCAFRYPRLLPIALGLFLASKQYLILTAPALVILALAQEDKRRGVDIVWQSLLVALLVTLPLALWDWKKFWFSNVTVQLEAPFRDDALSFLVWWKGRIGPTMFGRPVAQVASVVALCSVIPAAALVLWRAPRTIAGFAAGLTLTVAPFFAFNKQAFANYYYFVIACLCAAVAAAETLIHARPETETAPTPSWMRDD